MPDVLESQTKVAGKAAFSDEALFVIDALEAHFRAIDAAVEHSTPELLGYVDAARETVRDALEAWWTMHQGGAADEGEDVSVVGAGTQADDAAAGTVGSQNFAGDAGGDAAAVGAGEDPNEHLGALVPDSRIHGAQQAPQNETNT